MGEKKQKREPKKPKSKGQKNPDNLPPHLKQQQKPK